MSLSVQRKMILLALALQDRLVNDDYERTIRRFGNEGSLADVYFLRDADTETSIERVVEDIEEFARDRISSEALALARLLR